MGILNKLLKTEQKIRRHVEGVFGHGSAETPLEVRREILEQVESRIMPDQGGKIFPFGGVVVRLRPADPSMQQIFQAAFVDGASLENEMRRLLQGSGVRVPNRFYVSVQFEPAADRPDSSAMFVLEFISVEDVSERARPAARLLVVKGAAEESSYPIIKDRMLIGRLSELLDRDGQMARKNDIVFLDNGDDINSTVGRAHAAVHFSRDKHEFRISDEVSRYGTRIFRDGRSIEVPGGNPRGIRLRSGDEIYLGRACLRFEEGGEGLPARAWRSVFASRPPDGTYTRRFSVSKPESGRSPWFLGFRIMVAAIALLFIAAIGMLAQAPGSRQGMVTGVAFDGRMVADLDKSVAFYKALGFAPVEGVNPAWRKDEVFNRIHGTRGVESRMAKFTFNSNISGKPFTLYLREFRGLKRRNVMIGKPAWEPGATHIDLTVPDAQALWSRLKTAGMLRPRTWDGKLIPLPGQTKYSMAYITDPDGMDVEIVDQRPAIPATANQPARTADPPGFNHIGLVVLDSDKAKAFYGDLLGEEFPKTESRWISNNDFMDSAVGGHGNILRIFNGTFAEAADPSARMRFEVIEYQNRKKPVEPYSITDAGVNYMGLEVNDLEAFVGRLKARGITIVSDGIVPMAGGYRVALVRDPDVGAFVELFESPKK